MAAVITSSLAAGGPLICLCLSPFEAAGQLYPVIVLVLTFRLHSKKRPWRRQ